MRSDDNRESLLFSQVNVLEMTRESFQFRRGKLFSWGLDQVIRFWTQRNWSCCHSTAESTIWSRLRSSDANSNSHSELYSSPLDVHSLGLLLCSLQMFDLQNLEVVFPGGKHLQLWSYLQILVALNRSDNLLLHWLWQETVVLKWSESEILDSRRVVFPTR